MKILKEGIKTTKYFYCEKCGCVFEAEKSECITPLNYYCGWRCRCPCCGETAFEIENPDKFMV